MKDWLGIEIKPGCHVVYPGRQSSTIWMTLGRVEELHEEEGQAPGVTLTRLKQLQWKGQNRTRDVDPKQVKVDARHLTVVQDPNALHTYAEYQVKYLVTTDQEGVPQAIQGINGLGGAWSIDQPDVEIDGRAT